MEIFKQIAPLKSFIEGIKSQGKSIGLVPTMGALHSGHLSLVEASKRRNPVTIATIYVNPTQFNNPDDLKKYPKTLESDLNLLRNAGCDAVFCPDDIEMYGTSSIIKVDFGPMDKVMEGKFRPGHFSGVAIVVGKLFNIINPDCSYFGQKDWQQFAIIRQLVLEFKFNLALYSVPIVREPDGLAMSSRNLRLTPTQRANANVFYKGLNWARAALKQKADLDFVKRSVREMVEKTPEMQLEYIELADRNSLNILEGNNDKEGILCIAGYAGEVRLIDNMFLDQE